MKRKNYKKIPITIAAFQLTDSMATNNELTGLPIKGHLGVVNNNVCFTVDTLEGRMRAVSGDWIITGVEGEIYSCKDSIFKKTYEEEK